MYRFFPHEIDFMIMNSKKNQQNITILRHIHNINLAIFVLLCGVLQASNAVSFMYTLATYSFVHAIIICYNKMHVFRVILFVIIINQK